MLASPLHPLLGFLAGLSRVREESDGISVDLAGVELRVGGLPVRLDGGRLRASMGPGAARRPPLAP